MRKLLFLLPLLYLCHPSHAQQWLPGGTGIPIVCAYNSSPGTVATGLFIYAQCDSGGTLKTTASGGTVAANVTVVAPLGHATVDTGAISIVPSATATFPVSGPDPCFGAVKSVGDFESASSGGSIITAVSAKKAYICSISILTSAAANVSLIEGTGSSVCTGGSTAGVFLNTGVTAANGAAFATNGGIQSGDGNATIAVNSVANQNVCVAFTTTNTPQVNVHVSYVVQ